MRYDITSLDKRLQAIEELVKKESLRLEIHEGEVTRLRLNIDDRNEANEVLLKVVELFKSLGSGREQELLSRLEEFVSLGLSAVFGEKNIFKTALSSDGKDLKVDFFVDVEGIACDVTNAKGGGVAEVVSMLLQLFFVVAVRNKVAPVLILDTAMVHLSDQYHRNMSSLLKRLTNALDIQIILMAHSGEFGESADVLYEFSQEAGKTQARRLK